MHFSKMVLLTVSVIAPLSSSISPCCLAFQQGMNIIFSTTTKPSFSRGKMIVSMSDDDFFDGYDEFVSNLDFSEDGWNNQNPIGYGNDNRRNNQRRGGGRGRDRFNEGGHDYERARDDDVSSSNIDIKTVDSLIAQRLAHRKRGEFDQADDIRDHLLSDFGVTLWDKERTWTTNPDRRGGSNRHSANGRYGKGRGRNRRNERRERKPRDFGPTGHDYQQLGEIDPAICTLEITEINNLLAERLQAKMSRDFRTADEIQYHLKDQGVLVMDGIKEWRADGQEWERSQRAQRPAGPAFSKIREYTRRGACRGIPVEEVAEIEKQIQMRSEFKADRDYDAADEIKFALSDKYDITIDDRMLTWAVRAEEYILAEDSLPIPEETQLLIGEELRLRIIAKQDKDFDAADAIREELNAKYGIVIIDRLKEYKLEENEDNDEWFEAPAVEDLGSKEVTSDVIQEEEFKPPEVQDLNSLTVPLLKEKLRSAGLPVSGRKSELIDRLMNN